MRSPKVEITARGRRLGSPFRVWVDFRLVPFVASLLLRLLRPQPVPPVPSLPWGRLDQPSLWHRWHLWHQRCPRLQRLPSDPRHRWCQLGPLHRCYP